MTVINLATLATVLGGTTPIDATLEAVPWAGRGPASRTAGDTVVVPDSISLTLTDGVPDEDFDLEPTDGTFCWRIILNVPRAAGFRVKRYVTVPEVGPVDWENLVDVDPATFTPSLEAVAAWEAAIAEVQAIADEISSGESLDPGVAALVPDTETATGAALATLVDTLAGDAAVAGFVGDTESATGAALLASYAATDGVPRAVKPISNTDAGVLDWEYDSAVGYLLHLRAGENSGAATAAVGIGTDEGAGGAMVLALKNAGAGLSIGSHPSHTGKAFGLNSYGSAATPVDVSLYSGSDPLVIQHKLGMGFSDGVTTNASTTFTSATANFTAGDVGQTLTQTTSRGEGFRVPAGTTIVSVTNSTTVVMSAPATGDATGMNFVVGGRAVPANQEYIGFYNSAAEQTAAIAANKATFRCVLESFGGTSLTAPSQYVNGGSTKFYTHNGTNYTAHEINADSFAIRLRHYAAAGKGSEASPVQSIIATQSGGSARLGFFGASSTARPTVTGSRGGNAALASLITALATLGLITDSTSA